MPDLSHGNLSLGNLSRGGLVSAGLAPSTGAVPATLADSIALADASGYGFWSMAESSFYFDGSGLAEGKLYAWIDQTPTGHGGTLFHRSGSTSEVCPLIGDGYFRCRVGETERFWLNTPPIIEQLVMILIFRLPADPPPALADGFMFAGDAASGEDKPNFKLGLAAGGTIGWAYKAWSTAAVSSGHNRIAANVYDGGWHCLMIHHGSQAFEGLIIDVDGQSLLVDNDPPIDDFAVADMDGLWTITAGDNPHTLFDENEYTLDIASMAYGTDGDVLAHSATRALAESMMAVHGITSLA